MKYRAEVDGLRTIAVIPVILFHAGFEAFGGGFVGVDVFFVISGFLITTILLSDLEQERFSILRFYERRARRILPALFIVMLACIPFAWLWMLPARFEEFTASVVAVIAFVSNVLFLSQVDYFASDSELQPLLHTWSLAVEEQFYIVFPLLLWALWRLGRRRLLWLMVALALASLALSEWSWRTYPSTNFYLAHTRAWELLAGAICAFISTGRAMKGSNTLGMAGIALILYAIFAYDPQTPFPSLYATVPVGGAMLILLFARQGTWAARLLSLRPMVGVGLISYSAYLWHQPILAFSRIRIIEEHTIGLRLALVALSLILAYLTWRFVEQPFRRGPASLLQQRGRYFAACGLIAAAFVAFGLTADNSGFFRRNLDPAALKLMTYDSYGTRHFRQGCFLTDSHSGLDKFDRGGCLAMSPDKPNILLLGNSHAAHLGNALIDGLPGVNMLQATSSGCVPTWPIRSENRCTVLYRMVFDDFLPKNHLDAIILSSRIKAANIKNFPKTIEFLKQYADRIIVLGPSLEFDLPLNAILLHRARFSGHFGMADAKPFISQEIFDEDRALKAAVGTLPGVTYLSVLDALCDPDCAVTTPDGTLVTFDYGHLTYEGGRMLIDRLKPELAKAGLPVGNEAGRERVSRFQLGVPVEDTQSPETKR